MPNNRRKLLNFASNGHYFDNELPSMVLCESEADYEAKVREWEDNGKPNCVFIVPGPHGRKIPRHESEIDI